MIDPLAPDAQTEEAAPSEKVKAIRALTSAGYTLIPLNGKTPAIKGWTSTKYGQYGERELAVGNYGVALGPTDLVLDFDPRNYAKDDKPLARLTAAVGLPPTLTVRTGGGGAHFYFKKPADFAVTGKLKGYAGVDIRTAGGQVVGPGSVHPETGKEYTIVTDRPATAVEAPAALLELLKKAETNFETQPGTSTYQDDEGTRARYVSYLTTSAPTSGSYSVACRGRDLGLPPEMTLELMLAHWNARRATPRTPEEMKTRVAHAYQYAKGALGNAHPAAGFTVVAPPPEKEEAITWDTDKNGAPRKNFVNLLTYMRFADTGLRNVFGYNEFTGEVVFMNPAPWHKGRMPANKAVSDSDLVLLKKHLALRHAFEMPVTTLIEAMTATAHDHRFHPVKEYLTSLKWDGVKRLDTWLVDLCGAQDTPYVRAVARKMLCAAVLRVFKPGIKFDSVPVLEGGQGIGKSTICSILGGEWAGDFKVDPHSPDSVQLMQGHWLIELAELEVTRRSDEDALKAFLTRQTDKARLAYGRLAAQFPRQSIFIATKNPGVDGTYLKDATGNRRWWPVELNPKGGQVDFAGLKAARNQLFAEAVVRAQAGEKLFMETKELKAEAKAVVRERHADDPWLERVEGWLYDASPKKDFVTIRDVFIDGLGGIDQRLDRRTTLRIASVLHSLGWFSGFKRINGRFVRGFKFAEDDENKKVLDDTLEGLL